jgi:hypothetical protein
LLPCTGHVVELLESQHRPDASVDVAVILLNDIVAILALADRDGRKLFMQPIQSLAAGALRAVRAAGYLEVEGADIAVRMFHRATDGTLVTTRSLGAAHEVVQHDAEEGGSLARFTLRRMAEIPALAEHLAKVRVPA